jgi:hypothetical protein
MPPGGEGGGQKPPGFWGGDAPWPGYATPPIAPGGSAGVVDPEKPLIVPPGQPAPESLTVFIKPEGSQQWGSVKYVPSGEPKPPEGGQPPA